MFEPSITDTGDVLVRVRGVSGGDRRDTIGQCFVSCPRIFYVFPGDFKVDLNVSFPVDDTMYNITLSNKNLTLYRHVASKQHQLYPQFAIRITSL